MQVKILIDYDSNIKLDINKYKKVYLIITTNKGKTQLQNTKNK